MPRSIHHYPLEIVADHLLARVGRHRAVIDTGSPITLAAPSIVSRELGRAVRWLVGTDVLARHLVTLDWPARRLIVDGPAMPGERIPLTRANGLFQVELEGGFGRARAYLDSGAPISYLPATVAEGRTPVRRHSDYYPLFGSFEVDVYDVPVRVQGRSLTIRGGVLPPLLAAMLSMLGNDGWILGADFFRDRVITLDLRHDRIIDSTTPTPRQRITPREHERNVANHEMAIRAVNQPLHGWRGWRLVDRLGEPRLQSLSARHLWDGPVFSGDIPRAADSERHPTGVHAYATPGQMHGLVRNVAIVYGEVSLFGRACVHEVGYRAEHARIDRLYLKACGRHVSQPTAGVDILPLLAALERETPYCGCSALSPEEWLTYAELESLAARLGYIYQCDVIVDAERVHSMGRCRERHEEATLRRRR